MLADGGPTLEPSRRRARVDARRAARDALVLLVILEAVNKGISHLTRAREIAAVVAVAPDATPSAPERGVEEAIGAHREALHAASERVVVVGFDDEMQMVVLDRVLDD